MALSKSEKLSMPTFLPPVAATDAIQQPRLSHGIRVVKEFVVRNANGVDLSRGFEERPPHLSFVPSPVVLAAI